MTRKNWGRTAWVALTVLVGLTLAGCSNDGRPLTTLDPQGTPAEKIDRLSDAVFIVAGIVFVLVQGAVILLVLRFRRRKGDQDGVDEPVQIHGNNRLEWGWTFAPALILAVLAVFNVQTLWDLENLQVDAESQIEVIGQQWWWEFRYDVDADGEPDIITANQLVMPEDEIVRMSIRSNDVIHSFWIPSLNGKKDAVPGRQHGLALQAHEPGIYEGTCTEFCGLSHAYMRMQVKVLPRAAYDEWIDHQLGGAAEPEAGTVAAEGKDLFFQRCASCHQINGYDSLGESTGSDAPDGDYLGKDHPLTSDNAPNLTHLMSRERFAGNLFPLWKRTDDRLAPMPEGVPDEGQLARWLRDPPGEKPMAAEQNRGMPNLALTNDEIQKLVAYLTTLK